VGERADLAITQQPRDLGDRQIALDKITLFARAALVSSNISENATSSSRSLRDNVRVLMASFWATLDALALACGSSCGKTLSTADRREARTCWTVGERFFCVSK
jgi:hypothetical protein